MKLLLLLAALSSLAYCELINTVEYFCQVLYHCPQGTGDPVHECHNWWTIRTWTPDTPCVDMSAHQVTESSSRVLYQPRRRDKHPADSIEPHQSY